MESTAADRRVPAAPLPARLRSAAPGSLVAGIALAVLVAGILVAFFAKPTYPQYDSYYSLLWGRELLGGRLPTFEAYRAPTQHPLMVVAGAVLSRFGDAGDRLLVLVTMLSLVALVAAVYRLGRVSFSWLVGMLAALLVLTRFTFPFLAIRAYVDIPYLAIVFWAGALEATRPKRGTPVLLMLAAAGLLRPEAWVLSGLYFLYLFGDAGWPQRLRYAALAASAPLIWAGADALVTGNPLYSFSATRELAGELDRSRPLSEVPSTLPGFFVDQVKLPVAVAGVAGFLIAVWRYGRPALVPGTLLLAGVLTFLASAAAGLSVLTRYLLAPSVAICVFAAVTVAGFTIDPRPRRWRWWAAGAALVLVLGLAYTVPRLPSRKAFSEEASFQSDIHRSFRATLDDPAVARAIGRCGPLSVPTHKFVPEGRWILDLGEREVVARTDRYPDYGVAVFVSGVRALRSYSIGENEDARTQVPKPGFVLVRGSIQKYTSAYVHCPPGRGL